LRFPFSFLLIIAVHSPFSLNKYGSASFGSFSYF
jgi:hypothetical protein